MTESIQPSPAQLILAEIHHIREVLDVIEAQARELTEPADGE